MIKIIQKNLFNFVYIEKYNYVIPALYDTYNAARYKALIIELDNVTFEHCSDDIATQIDAIIKTYHAFKYAQRVADLTARKY